MVPWETLRRLLGLPLGMEPPDSAALVRLALEQPRHARLIGMALRGRTPKEAPAALLVAAHDRGTLGSEWVAELLGCVGHPVGYETARTMLFASDEEAPCAAAGVAAARMLGRRAEADLTLALHVAPVRVAREGAALGLCELGSAEAAASVTEAGLEGRIRIRVAARCVARMPFDAERWLELLEAPALRSRRLATEVVYELSGAPNEGGGTPLEELGERGKQAVRRALADGELYMLPDKREQLSRWAGR